MSVMRVGVAAAMMIAASPALAEPGGADWDHHGGPGRADCTACHFGAEPRRQSEKLVFEGAPARLEAGKTYALSLRLSDPNLVTAGFLIRAEYDGGAPAGEFEAADARAEANGATLRSTLEGSRQAKAGEAAWEFRWRAPAEIAGAVAFHIAANAANDDLSPFGDVIYLSTIAAGEKN